MEKYEVPDDLLELICSLAQLTQQQANLIYELTQKNTELIQIKETYKKKMKNLKTV